ncbi:MAG TPA: glycosyltransferase [Myxococcota bacterium]|nr:glycosyltransferase [Myxococcota bacterium]
MRVGLIVECAVPFVCDEVAALRSVGVEVALASAFRPGPDWRAAFGGEVGYPQPGRRAWVARALRDGLTSGPRLADLIGCALAERVPLRLVALAATLARRARRERWRHVHASFATYPAWLAWATGHLARLPFSFTAHAYDVQEPRPWLARVAVEAAFVRAISIETAMRVRAAAGSAARVRVGHLGVDVERFCPGNGTVADPPEILTVARIGPTKGIEVLIEAARLLASGDLAQDAAPARFRVRILGDGPLREACAARARALGLHEVVCFDGAATSVQVSLALRRATIFALPCVPVRGGARHDGLPVALLEAMASALPVVSTPVGGIPEAVTDGDNGVLVPSSDAHQLAAALAKLLNDAGLRRRLGTAARVRVLRQFRGDAAAARLAAWMADVRPSSPKKTAGEISQEQAEARA